MAKKSKTIAENGVFWHKKGLGPTPQKPQIPKKSFFSYKPMIIQLLVKFKQKMAKKSKTIAENGVFWHKKGPGPSPQKTQKSKKSLFHTNSWFYNF